jgi:hypothetical protein
MAWSGCSARLRINFLDYGFIDQAPTGRAPELAWTDRRESQSAVFRLASGFIGNESPVERHILVQAAMRTSKEFSVSDKYSQ